MNKKYAAGIETRESAKHTSRNERHFLVFAGTSEGRELAEFMDANQVSALVCVATEYGEELLHSSPFIRVKTGRMDQSAMEDLIGSQKPLAVIDATHPYADEATKNIRAACGKTQTAYYRLLRNEAEIKQEDGLIYFEDPAAAARWLNGQEGNILLTTGIKELPVFAGAIEKRERIYVRALLQDDIFAKMAEYGLSKKQVICMQGPFSREMNAATIRMTEAEYLVTKESGAAGGFREKVEAAQDCGAICAVIRRPLKEDGFSVDEIRKIVLDKWNCNSNRCSYAETTRNQSGRDDENMFRNGRNMNVREYDEVYSENSCGKGQSARRITLLGIGMGGRETMTLEAVNACREADCIIGARRMLEALRDFEKPTAAIYLSSEIADYIRAHSEYKKIVIAFSGDVGFYSGAKQLLETFGKGEKETNEIAAPEVRQLESDGQRIEIGGRQFDIRLLPGISSVAYFAAKLHMPWEDMKLISSHGREQNLISAVRCNEKVFTLASDAKSICSIAEKLALFGLGDIRMYVGANLSYPSEAIYEGSARDYVNFDSQGMFVAVFMNPQACGEVVTHGICDAAFLRGSAPMTKEEVRSVSISKLQLTRDAVVYDVGAGTGSVAVECARMADRGRVYAIEWKEDAWKLVAENRKRFAVSNLEIVPGRAPDVLRDLPAPTHVFIGGSGGNLKSILSALIKKNPSVRIVLNCITLETLTETLTAADDLRLTVSDIACVTVAKSKSAGKYHMMTGQNPVYVITCYYSQPIEA
ncbi:MAG: precorrin-6A reductase [Clostridiales bacterium]|nr:precorrin-6A reductase [Clostridiales bacterium]